MKKVLDLGYLDWHDMLERYIEHLGKVIGKVVPENEHFDWEISPANIIRVHEAKNKVAQGGEKAKFYVLMELKQKKRLINMLNHSRNKE